MPQENTQQTNQKEQSHNAIPTKNTNKAKKIAYFGGGLTVAVIILVLFITVLLPKINDGANSSNNDTTKSTADQTEEQNIEIKDPESQTPSTAQTNTTPKAKNSIIELKNTIVLKQELDPRDCGENPLDQYNSRKTDTDYFDVKIIKEEYLKEYTEAEKKLLNQLSTEKQQMYVFDGTANEPSILDTLNQAISGCSEGVFFEFLHKDVTSQYKINNVDSYFVYRNGSSQSEVPLIQTTIIAKRGGSYLIASASSQKLYEINSKYYNQATANSSLLQIEIVQKSFDSKEYEEENDRLTKLLIEAIAIKE